MQEFEQGMASMEPTSQKKPKMRGVLHQVAAFLALIAVTILVTEAPTSLAAWSAAIYGSSLVALLGISATYHRPDWGPIARLRMRRLDHSAIFVLIAGTYTPLCLLVLPPAVGRTLLLMAWGGALLGVVQSILWPNAPRAVVVTLCVALGLVVLTQWSVFVTTLSVMQIGFIAGGGLAYILGAVFYASKRPNPLPGVFGYHEVFHALVVVAATLHFVAVRQVVLGS